MSEIRTSSSMDFNTLITEMNMKYMYMLNIVYLLSSDGHINRGTFYNNECIKLDHFIVHLLMWGGGHTGL